MALGGGDPGEDKEAGGDKGECGEFGGSTGDYMPTERACVNRWNFLGRLGITYDVCPACSSSYH